MGCLFTVIKVTANEEHFYKYTDILDYYFDTDIAIKDIKKERSLL